ncbi:glycosyltransferase family 4 protein [Arthrobacter burdickii]|uniref:D-inositol 3-phosphate glycosyltransferase n=1 Tax=Arthrobacter burdickii TaxID=3035920 RepID=A0ABT8K547_9MICC|nr:glycosyltransferase family 4 protein [Arthrobacter burdickii]MDN4612579.1 glycosyltransferase family 4 protein [Arthrobacter burdickii]
MIAGLHYSPEPTGNAPYTSGLASGLVQRGVKTKVITGFPHYPEWRRREGYDGWEMSEQIDGVPVRRLNHFVPSNPRGLARLWMEVSFGLRLATARWGRPQTVVLVSPALFSTGLALLRARLTRQKAPVVVWVQDIYSLGMTETGESGAAGARAMRWVESAVLRSADGVVVIHDRFRTYLETHLNVDAARVKVVRNWTHLKPFVLQDRAASRVSLGWNSDDIIVLHAGNMGAKQGLDNVVEAARVVERRGSRVRFVLVGDGNQRPRLEQMAKGSVAISFIDSLPGERFQEALAAADVLLVNELPGVKEMSVPSKLTSYFSAGIPVLAATDAGSVTAAELANAQAGLRVDPGTPEALVAGAEALAADPELSSRLARNGRLFMETTLSENHAVAQYHQYLTHLVAGPHPE